MSRKRYTPEEIVAKLRQADVLMSPPEERKRLAEFQVEPISESSNRAKTSLSLSQTQSW